MSKKTEQQKGYGLLPTPEDDRDFSLAGVFGAIELTTIPLEDWVVTTPLEIKDQGSTDMCTAYSLCAVSEDQEGVPLDPGFVFAMIKRERGEYLQWGADLRSGVKVATKVGFLKRGDNPQDFGQKPRNFIANWKNWPLNLLLPKAKAHIKESFFKVDGPYDTFDNMRAALWQHQSDKRSIYTGCVWQSAWNGVAAGVVPKRVTSAGVGHAFKVFGQKIINGEPYLMVQNSFGTDSGDNGIFYFPRMIVNRYFTFGAYMLIDMPRTVAENLDNLAKGRIRKKESIIITFLKWLLRTPYHDRN